MVFRTPHDHGLAADRPVLRSGVFTVPTRIIRIESFDSPNAVIEGRLVGASRRWLPKVPASHFGSGKTATRS